MSRLLLILTIAAIGGGVWVAQKYKIEGLDRFALKPRGDATTAAETAADPSITRPSGAIRIASYHLRPLTFERLARPGVAKGIADVLRRFDVAAVQGVNSARDDLMPRLIDQLNAGGRCFDFVIGPRSGREPDYEQLAIVYDASSVEIDPTATYTVADPGHLMRHDPLVASFRVRGPAPDTAFTFKLVNIHIEPEAASIELPTLGDVYRAVLHDGQDEDDVILAGDLGVDERRMAITNQIPTLTTALSATPTTLRGKSVDNLIFSRDATTEFTGHSGVLDVARELNLTTNQALDLSDHLPVWAEFSIYEGGRVGRLAWR